MNSQNHSLAGSNQSHQIVKESGQFNIMGNGNKINFKQCQGRLNIMGNGNQLFLLKCTFEINLNGNENKICTEKGEVRVGINGNNNEVIQSASQNNSVWMAPSQKITVMFNNGNNNIFPKQGRKNQGRSCSMMIGTNIPEQRENFSQMNPMMNGMMGMMGWGGNFGSANTGYPYNYNYNQYYQPPSYPMPSPYWGMQMGNPFQTVYQSQTHNPNGNFGYNPFTQSNSTSNSHNWNDATINSNHTNRNQYSPTRTLNRQGGSSNGNYPYRNGEYRYQPQGDDGRTQVPRIAELTSTRSRNNPHSRTHRQRQVIEIESDGEVHEIEQLPYFGQRPRYQFHPNSGAVRYAFNLNESVPGLSEDQVSMLPRSEHKGQPAKCSICLDDVSEGNQVTYLFCFHSFHTECGINWLRKSATCPLCQLDLRPHLKTLQ